MEPRYQTPGRCYAGSDLKFEGRGEELGWSNSRRMQAAVQVAPIYSRQTRVLGRVIKVHEREVGVSNVHIASVQTP